MEPAWGIRSAPTDSKGSCLSLVEEQNRHHIWWKRDCSTFWQVHYLVILSCRALTKRFVVDVWTLNVNDPTRVEWKEMQTKGSKKPSQRGYHSMNLYNDQAIIYGGSDGEKAFVDCWILDLGEEIVLKTVPVGLIPSASEQESGPNCTYRMPKQIWPVSAIRAA